MPSSTVEDYIKRLYIEQSRHPGRLVPMGRLADAMAVVPGTVTSMIKALADSGLVEYEPRAGVRLTAGGERLALHVLRRHRLLELFLVKTLGLDWSEVHAEAEELEHAVSDKVLDRIDALLGHPTVDPHGSPIPSHDGSVSPESTTRLADVAAGTSVKIARVQDDDPRFLRFAERHGLVPGASVDVLEADSVAGTITLQSAGRPPCTMGVAAAERVFIEPAVEAD